MASGDLTVYAVLGLPGPWPPLNRSPLLSLTGGDGRNILLSGYPDGHLEVTVSQGPKMPPFAVMHFQRVHVTGPNLMVLTITQDGGRLRAWINGSELPTLADSSGDVLSIPEHAPQDLQRSYAHPEATRACQPAVIERADRFRKRKPFQPKVASRSKTPSEQLDELRQGVAALRHLIEAMSGGAPHLVPALASQLRGLVYWPPRSKDSPNWNPLLLRLANSADLPLPIFAMPDSSAKNGLPLGPVFLSENLVPSCHRRYPADTLMDLEDYLEVQVLHVMTPSGDRTASVADILAATANSMGSAHYDETVPLYLDDLDAQVFLGRTAVHVLIVGAAEVVAELGDYLLTRLSGDAVVE